MPAFNKSEVEYFNMW
uniref:Uncharacterized protein n=1 Tax=Anguilla anguilla TaxID=7936 RepID=A0A0E9PKS9_ANGAN